MAVFDIFDELSTIVDVLNDKGVDYAICGAVALAVHGRPRATTDIDVLVASESLTEAKSLLRGLGYDLEAAPMSFSSGVRVHRQSRVEGDDLFTVEVLEAAPPLDGVWNGRIVLRWRGHPLSVVSRDGLIEMKRLANRLQDRADLEALGADDDRCGCEPEGDGEAQHPLHGFFGGPSSHGRSRAPRSADRGGGHDPRGRRRAAEEAGPGERALP